MSKNKILQVKIITPNQEPIQKQVQSAAFIGEVGVFEILVNHEPLFAKIKPGNITLKLLDGSTEVFESSSGIVITNGLECSVLVEKFQ